MCSLIMNKCIDQFSIVKNQTVAEIENESKYWFI